MILAIPRPVSWNFKKKFEYEYVYKNLAGIVIEIALNL